MSGTPRGDPQQKPPTIPRRPSLPGWGPGRRAPAADEAPSAAGDASQTARDAGLLYPGNSPGSCTSQDKALKLPKGPPLLIRAAFFDLKVSRPFLTLSYPDG